MYLDYQWIKEYLPSAPSSEEAARLLNLTGLESEVDGDGLEIEHTVNRPDAMSHYGLARELAVKLDANLNELAVYDAPIPKLEGWTFTSEEPHHCDRYMGLRISGVKASPSPPWLVEKLEAIDQTCHNFLVDLTNFLLWELGHPSHAFDATKLNGQEIKIRFGEKGETLTTLDGRFHQAENLLCITDAKNPIAFGGVMGGQNTQVDSETTELLLELACFRGSTVRRTGKACNIESDARHRFERGVDREKMDRVIRRFAHLLLEEQPNAQIIGLLDMDLAPFKRQNLLLRKSRLDRILGVSLPETLVSSLLERMDCKPEKTDDGWNVQPPGYKVDVTREVDIIEEVIRFAGFEFLPSTLPGMGGTDLTQDPIRIGENQIREQLSGIGYQETCTYSFLSEEHCRRFAPDAEMVNLRNPMTINQAVMRRHILPNMLNCVQHNMNRGLGGLRLFELGHVFEGETEPHHLALTLTHEKDKNHWWDAGAAHPFYRMKGVFELLQQHLGWSLSLKPEVPCWLQKGEALGVYFQDTMIGGFGMLSQELSSLWGFDLPIAVMELDLGFLSASDRIRPEVKVLPQFPGIKIDMAFVLDQSHEYSAIQQYLTKLRLPFLESLGLFDVYQGKAVEKGQRSLGFRFKFQAPDRTLTSEEVSETMEQVVETMKTHFGAHIRM